MSDTSTILSLPYILPAQAQKHVTHNEAIRLLDVIVQLSVTARDLAVPPASPAQADRYIVAVGASGGWAGKSGQIAVYDDGAWQFFAPIAGWTAWIMGESVLASYNGAAWVSAADGPQTFGQLGISATSDDTNRLTVSSAATLLNHAGAGHQLKINKALVGDTASLLFQTGFSGRAEMGTAGNDDFSIKVSADGAAFVTGVSIAKDSGQVTLPAALRLGGQAADPAAPANGMIWLNTTTGEVKVRSNGVNVVLASASGNAQLADMASARIKGRIAAGAGAPQDLTGAEVAGLLPVVTSGAAGLAPASGGGATNFLRADGTWAAPSGGGDLISMGVNASAAQINALAAAPAQHLLMSNGVNLAPGANDFENSTYWPITFTQDGVTAQRVGVGFENDVLYQDVRFTGTPSASVAHFNYQSALSRTASAIGDAWTVSFVARRVGGTLAGVNGLRANIVTETSPATFVSNGFSDVVPAESDTVVSKTLTTTAGNQVRAQAFLSTVVGVPIDVTYRIKEMQFDAGAARAVYSYRAASPAAVRAALGQGARLIRTVNITSAVASVNFTSADMDLTQFSDYVFVLRNLRPTATAGLRLRTSSDGGVTFAAGASDYAFALDAATSAPSQGQAGSAGVTSVALNFATTHATVGGGMSGEIRLFGCDTPLRQKITFHTTHWRSDSYFERVNGGAMRLADAQINGVQFLFSTGNIAADANASISIYGVPK